MKKSPNILKLLIIGFIATLFLTACQGEPVSQANVTSDSEVSEPVTLKIAVLPILDALPMYVAEQEGLFEANNVRVTFIAAASAAERDQIIVAGQADGLINELVSTVLYNKDQVQVQVVRFARVATTQFPQYYILASKQSGITTPQELKGVDIGISQGTVIEYITDRLLQAEGLTAEDIKTIAVPKIPDRMALLSSGELRGATMPDPLSLLAIQQGAVLVLDDTKYPDYSYSTIAFRKAVIDQNPEAIRNFLQAIEEATAKINANPSQWAHLLTEKQLVPESLVGDYQLPTYPAAGVPSQAQWDDVVAWCQDKGLLTTDIAYSDSVTDQFLP
ncbi:MAG: ABC transporter substrate-binding protein [Anaerolineales bacterium]|nr:ABC transporter substrate-binding protein [Anaerolineales bacterium]